MESAEDSDNSSHPGTGMVLFPSRIGVCFFPPLNLADQVTFFDQKNIVEVMLCQLRGLLVSVFAFGSHCVHN